MYVHDISHMYNCLVSWYFSAEIAILLILHELPLQLQKNHVGYHGMKFNVI